ncbi:unnamed protein product, partial [marine sediment metagenome]
VSTESWNDYVAMEALDTKVVIGAIYSPLGPLGDFFEDKIDNVILFKVKLTPAQIATLWNDGD